MPQLRCARPNANGMPAESNRNRTGLPGDTGADSIDVVLDAAAAHRNTPNADGLVRAIWNAGVMQ